MKLAAVNFVAWQFDLEYVPKSFVLLLEKQTILELQ
jgi:hypothetical protein